MSFHFGISLVCDDTSAFPDWVRTVERCGFDRIGLTDSPALYPETYVTGVLCAQNTTRLQFGPRVTNPITRHPIVTARGIVSLAELAPGRVLLGMGTGDSAAHSAGKRRATLREVELYIAAVRGLIRDGRAEYEGETLTFDPSETDIPIYMAASGPKALRKAAAIADGIIVGTGVTSEAIQAALDHIRAGAAEAGRDWRDLDLWWLSGCRVEEDRATAEEKMLSVSAAIFNAHFRTSLEGKALPEELRQQATNLLDRYDFTHHIKHGARATNGELLATMPALRRHVTDRYLIGGSPEDCIRQLERAAEAGASQFWWTASFPDKMEFVTRFAPVIAALH
jgi:5,10-methylenetetrahydromethanopterin reductase